MTRAGRCGLSRVWVPPASDGHVAVVPQVGQPGGHSHQWPPGPSPRTAYAIATSSSAAEADPLGDPGLRIPSADADEGEGCCARGGHITGW